MLVIGCGGHALEILEIIYSKKWKEEISFYDDINGCKSNLLKEAKVLSSMEDVKNHFLTNNEFVLGIGGTILREKMYYKFISAGGNALSIIAKNAKIGRFDVILESGLNIMQDVFISNNVKISKGTLINYAVSIHHDSVVGKFCEISPKAQLLGGVEIGDKVMIGAGSIILPGVKIGDNAIIGAGSVVTRNVNSNTVSYGVPSKERKNNEN